MKSSISLYINAKTDILELLEIKVLWFDESINAENDLDQQSSNGFYAKYNEHVNCFTKKVIEVSNISCTFVIIDYPLFFNIDVSFNKHMHVS